MYSLGSKIIAHLSKVDALVQNQAIAPVTCEIDPSNFCQNSCTWCIYSDYISNNRTNLNYVLFESIVDQLKRVGCKSITFTGGGEPTANVYFKDMLEYALKQGFKVGLITNGILLQHFIEYWDYFEFIRVSLDCADKETYKRTKGTSVFDKVCQNIMDVCNHSTTDMGISAVHTSETESKKFIDLGQKMGVKFAQIKPLVDSKVEATNNSLKRLKSDNFFATERYLVNGSNLPCKIAGLIGQVGADGKYYYCCIHRGNPKYEIGNLATTSLRELIKKRAEFAPDLNDCFSCRYMNYAKEYQKVKSQQYQMLRHIDFI